MFFVCSGGRNIQEFIPRDRIFNRRVFELKPLKRKTFVLSKIHHFLVRMSTKIFPINNQRFWCLWKVFLIRFLYGRSLFFFFEKFTIFGKFTFPIGPWNFSLKYPRLLDRVVLVYLPNNPRCLVRRLWNKLWNS